MFEPVYTLRYRSRGKLYHCSFTQSIILNLSTMDFYAWFTQNGILFLLIYKIDTTFVNELPCVKINSSCETWWPSHHPSWITNPSCVVCTGGREYLVSWGYGALCSGSDVSPQETFNATITFLLFAFFM